MLQDGYNSAGVIQFCIRGYNFCRRTTILQDDYNSALGVIILPEGYNSAWEATILHGGYNSHEKVSSRGARIQGYNPNGYKREYAQLSKTIGLSSVCSLHKSTCFGFVSWIFFNVQVLLLHLCFTS